MRSTLALGFVGACVACSSSNSTPANAPTADTTVQISAKQFEYTPSVIHVKAGQSVVLELTSTDRVHGFNLPDFNVRTDVNPGQTTSVRIMPNKTGTFVFHCDNFCGSGHEGMMGQLVVE